MTWDFDGDKRRIYEVPDNSSFTTDGNGYKIYVPNDIPSAETAVQDTTFSLWSRWVDYHNLNKWARLAFDISGGAFRFTDGSGNDVFALPDIRLINDWQIVVADYSHSLTIIGNLYPNISNGQDFDTSRITSVPIPSPRIQFSDRGERALINSGATTAQEIRDAMKLTPTAGSDAPGSVDDLLKSARAWSEIAARNSPT